MFLAWIGTIIIKENSVSKFGLIGKNIDYSFSRSFFSEKFMKEGLSHSYSNFDIESIDQFPEIILRIKNLKGLNVTIPYKEEIIPYLDGLDKTAEAIGAVNVIKIDQNKKLVGYNSDCFGFQKSLAAFLPLKNKSALILGTGGASKAVAFALAKLGFDFIFVSRKKSYGSLLYEDLDKTTIESHSLIVNCTPLGTFPNISAFPPIPYPYLTPEHLLFDLIYNPLETQFLRRGRLQGSKTRNGFEMLTLQAEKAWEIWNL